MLTAGTLLVSTGHIVRVSGKDSRLGLQCCINRKTAPECAWAGLMPPGPAYEPLAQALSVEKPLLSLPGDTSSV